MLVTWRIASIFAVLAGVAACAQAAAPPVPAAPPSPGPAAPASPVSPGPPAPASPLSPRPPAPATPAPTAAAPAAPPSPEPPAPATPPSLGPQAPQAPASSAPAAAAPTSAAPAEASGEAFGGLSLGLTDVAAVKLLGEPGTRGKVIEEAASGLLLSTWTWPAKGATVVMDASSKGTAKVHSIQLSAPSSLRTAKGIGIGSKRAEVVAAYRSRISTEAGASTDPSRIVVGSIYDGVIFDMKGDKVVGIFVGAAAE